MLDVHQQLASEKVDGSYFITAPAGSGKTTTSVKRIQNLIDAGIDSKRILYVTFSKKASEDMQTKVDSLIGENNVKISTLHSLSFYLYRKLAKKSFQVIDQYRQSIMIKKIIQSKNIDKRLTGEILFAIPKLKANDIWYTEKVEMCNMILDMEIDYGTENSYPLINTIEDVYRTYEEEKLDMTPQGIDFEDMMFKLNRYLNKFPEKIKLISRLWDYILVDEFQDTSYLQFQIIKKIMSGNNNIYVIGDVNQCIYEWREAHPEYMKKFDEHFDGAENIKLKNTYRCAEKITKVANMLIDKDDHAISATGEQGEVKLLFGLIDEFEEANIIAKMIKEQYAEDFIKILFRTNAQAIAFEITLAKHDIPYKLIGQQQFFNRKEVKDMLAYVDVIYNKPPTFTESWERIINRPNRYLGKAFVSQIKQLSGTMPMLQALKTSKFSKPYMNKNAYELAYLIEECKFEAPEEIIYYVLNKFKYLEWIAGEEDKKEADNSNSAEMVNEVIELAKNMGDVESLLRLHNVRTNPLAKVELMTIHKSKGLEADTVFVVGVNQGILPHKMSQNIDEEKRLLYVAVTRAKRNLIISSTAMYGGKRTRLSEFITNISGKEDFKNVNTFTQRSS